MASLQLSFIAYPPDSDQDEQEIIDRLKSGNYEVCLISNYGGGKSKSLNDAAYVLLRQPRPSRQGERLEGSHWVEIKPNQESENDLN